MSAAFDLRTLWSRTQAAISRNRLRLRLTVIYGGLFLVTGLALLATTYVLVDRATSNGDAGVTVGVLSIGENPSGGFSTGPTPSPQQMSTSFTSSAQLHRVLSAQHQRMLHQLIWNGGVALLAMLVAAIAIGWLISGRLLRPLRSITATARDISATNLHRRLALPGSPDEVTELGDTIDALLQRLESAFEAQRRFVANASHELRTPLTRQRALGQMALDDPDANVESLRTAHKRILVAGEQQNRLIDALLDLARGQSGSDHVVSIDLAAAVDTQIALRQHTAMEHSITIAADLGSASVLGDPRLLDLLIANLLDNALAYNVEPGSVMVSTRSTEGAIELRVTNTGPVVDPDVAATLIQPFRRAQTDRTSTTGTGLGLSIVDAVATAHRGSLQVEAIPTGGLSVTVVLPIGQ